MDAPGAGGARVAARGWGWRHAGRARWAVSDIDLVIEPGERVLVLGASGSGKSTLLHALAGVLGGAEEGEERGELTVDGAPPVSARGHAGLVLQDPDSQVILSRVGDDVAFGCENLGVPAERIWPRVREALDAVGLELPLDHPSDTLSGGQKQRLALAGALAMRPRLLLLDEPTANLDPHGVREVRDAVTRVLERSEATFVVVEHRVEVWLDLVNRVVVLDPEGGVLADGSPHAVLDPIRERLAAAGVWVPGVPLRAGTSQRPLEGGAWELRGRELTIGRGGVPLRSETAVELPRGASTVLTGPNGAGKSTLALTLGGLLPALGGAVEASPGLAAGLGVDPFRWKSRHLLTRIGTVFQEPEHQFVASTVRRELGIGPHALGLGKAETARRVAQVLERLRLAHLAEANPFTLSGGEKRRLSVGAVLAAAPRVLILDEPTFGQDRLSWIELVRMLRELVEEGATVLSVTHDEAYGEALGDHRIALAARERVASAPAGGGRR